MKLTKNLTEKDLKNISKINITIWNACQDKDVTFYVTLTPLKTKVRFECKSVWKNGDKVVNVKNEKRYESFYIALIRINYAVIAQKRPTATSTHLITYEHI